MNKAILLAGAFALVTSPALSQTSEQKQDANQQTDAVAAVISGDGSDLGDQVPPVYAPGLDSGTNDCAVSASGGGAVSGFGLSFGASFENEDCQRRNWFVLQSRAGNPGVAKALACHNDEVREAYRLAGKPCPQEKARREQAGGKVPPYCEDGGMASKDTIRENCPNATQLLE